ncbi:rhomboid family intramembrane serine protease [Propionimicrobium sp. PCR01-08-3]|uniref:rhomboid family intramembrane serine protease n=1 Tax=Propionimicrobium sp. PCR01-08-3 TaxID=3052086 RepID=UPI00255C50AA|nr:rhomboid family intramembrane serine protease [Propionimicrobium sp. PCR01-08-3]WIY84085.1 rhomboid family intramembrane serine protease [Propionimicrobium sp. PCR01-08-3]
MAGKQDDSDHEWPDFIPPEFEQPDADAPDQPTPPPTASGPVLPPVGDSGGSNWSGGNWSTGAGNAGYWTNGAGHSPSGAQASAGRERKQSADRWFNRPAAGGTPASYFPGGRGRTPVTTTLIVVCVVLWVLQNIVPMITSAMMLVPSVAAVEPWRFITSAFVHAPRSLTHIGFNMLTLWLMGRYLEPMLKTGRFLAVYLISALGGSTLFVVLASPPDGAGQGSNWNTAALGASGAVFGLFGAYLVFAWAMKQSLTPMLALLALNLVIAVLVPGIGWAAHIGGFIAGAAATAVIIRDIRRPRRDGGRFVWLGLAGVTVLLIGVNVAKYATV